MVLANSPLCNVWQAYCNVLTERPLFTKIITGMVGTFLGDLLAQVMQAMTAGSQRRQHHHSHGQHFELDVGRTARLMGYSALVGTPLAQIWFDFLDQVRPAPHTHAVVHEDMSSAVCCFCRTVSNHSLSHYHSHSTFS